MRSDGLFEKLNVTGSTGKRERGRGGGGLGVIRLRGI